MLKWRAGQSARVSTHSAASRFFCRVIGQRTGLEDLFQALAQPLDRPDVGMVGGRL
jgi:hypothetical protein